MQGRARTAAVGLVWRWCVAAAWCQTGALRRAVTAKQARTLAVDGAMRTVASTAAKAEGSCDCPMPTYRTNTTQAHFKNDFRKRETKQRSARRKRGTPQTVVTHARQLGVIIYARRLGETTLISNGLTLHSVLSSLSCVLCSLFWDAERHCIAVGSECEPGRAASV